jgi:hypothetical protein
MRKMLLSAACAALMVPVLASATTPRLTTLSRATFTVRGVGFAPKERIKVVASTEGHAVTKWTTSGARGGFTMPLPMFTVGSCNGSEFVLRALGATGDRAVLMLHRLPPECPQPLSP